MQEVLRAFGLTAPVLETVPLSGGRIHGTFRVRTRDGIYIAQKLHPTAFPQPERLMEKLVSVTDYLRRHFPDCVTLHFYPAQDGSYLYDGWRVADCIPGVVRTDRRPETVFAAGKAFGAFQAMLREFPSGAEQPFHDPEKRFSALFVAAQTNPLGRLDAAQEVLSRLSRLRDTACALQHAGLPLRTVHNDTKPGNLLFLPASGKPLAVIDLDTVGTGLAVYDLGDAVRSLHGTTGQFDPEILRTFAAGFTEGASHLTQAERDSLPLGVVSITAELAARYLTDYLTGDRYFRSPDSLGRAAELTALAESAENSIIHKKAS